jgi:uncharacterized lipoprotein YddW (UPF0748 family)
MLLGLLVALTSAVHPIAIGHANPQSGAAERSEVAIGHRPQGGHPQSEVRALWVVRSSLTSPAAIQTIVTQAAENGFNTLIVQVRGRGELYCNSSLEPRACELAAQPPQFDPLAEILRAGHAAGLQVHAWLNMMYVWSSPKPPACPEHIVHTHPDWLMVNRAGRKVAVGCREGVFLCPSHPEARRHLHDLVLDIAERYNVDGIQFDYIRYPSAEFCYCMGCLTRFKREASASLPPSLRASLARRTGRLVYPQVLSSRWANWRRGQITSLVRWIHRDVKALRPSLVVSAAVIAWGSYPGDFRRSAAHSLLGQDWYGWLEEGIVDAVAPMTYQPSTAAFTRWVRGVRRDRPRATVWFGIAAYLCSPKGTTAKIAAARAAGSAGWSLFSYSAVTKDGRDDAYLRAVRDAAGLPVIRLVPVDTAEGTILSRRRPVGRFPTSRSPVP